MEDVECPVLDSLIATVTAVNEQRQDGRKKEREQTMCLDAPPLAAAALPFAFQHLTEYEVGCLLIAFRCGTSCRSIICASYTKDFLLRQQRA